MTINHIEQLSAYILRPLVERTGHLDTRFMFDPNTLDCCPDAVSPDECVFTPEFLGYTWESYCHYHGLIDDIPNKQVLRIARLHVCSCDSTNGWCRNPSHSFIGTQNENVQMVVRSGNHNMAGTRLFTYKHPDTGVGKLMTPDEAEAAGYVHVVKGTKRITQICPYCGLEGSAPRIVSHHFENCHMREGSELWLRDRERENDPRWRRDGKKWRLRKSAH